MVKHTLKILRCLTPVNEEISDNILRRNPTMFLSTATSVFWILETALRLEEQEGTQTFCSGCTVANTGNTIDNNMDTRLILDKWFKIKFARYYRIEYIVIGSWNSNGNVHIIFGNSSNIDEGKKCTELAKFYTSTILRTTQCDQDITWIAKFIKFYIKPYSKFNIRELQIFGFET